MRIVILIITLFLSAYSEWVFSSPIADQCPFGHRYPKKVIVKQVSKCEAAAAFHVNAGSIVSDCSYTFDDTGNRSSAYFIKVRISDCAHQAADDTGENGCYPDEDCKGNNQKCDGPTEETFQLHVSQSCNDYCEGSSVSIDQSTTPPEISVKGSIHQCGTNPEGYEGERLSDSETDGSDVGQTDRDVDESQCGIGQRFTAESGCQPLDDSCGYVNGIYTCMDSAPPDGCGQAVDLKGNVVDGCFEDPKGCGYVNGQWVCLDAIDETNCGGGIIVNGVCNRPGEDPVGGQCPSSMFWDGQQCLDRVSKCPLGTIQGPNGQCVEDRCTDGNYELGGHCLPAPSDPGSAPDSDKPDTGEGDSDSGTPDDSDKPDSGEGDSASGTPGDGADKPDSGVSDGEGSDKPGSNDDIPDGQTEVDNCEGISQCQCRHNSMAIKQCFAPDPGNCSKGYGPNPIDGKCERDDCNIGEYSHPHLGCQPIQCDNGQPPGDKGCAEDQPAPDKPDDPKPDDKPDDPKPDDTKPDDKPDDKPGDGDGSGSDSGSGSGSGSGKDDDKESGPCDPTQADYLTCIKLNIGSGSFDGFDSLDSQIKQARQNYESKFSQIANDFKNKIKIQTSSVTSPFYHDYKTVMGAEVDFGTARLQPFLQYLPALVMFMAAVYSGFVILGGHRS